MKRHAGAAERNQAAIADVLARLLPARGSVLEIASGTGQHVVFFGERFPDLSWQPTDVDRVCLESIAGWVSESGLDNVRAPLRLDVTEKPWPIDRADVVLCSNMVHITPWRVTEGLFEGAGRILEEGGLLLLYGPYKFGGRHTAPSNEAFDARLRSEDPEWGVRDADELTLQGERCGLALAERVPMPTNNFILAFRRTGTTRTA